MKITKNKTLNVGYVSFKKGKVSKTVELLPGILIDFDKSGGVMGIEILSLNVVAPQLSQSKKRNRKSA